MSELPPLTSPLLDLPGVRHAFFTRQGGVSEGIYASLECGGWLEGRSEAVTENRRRAPPTWAANWSPAYQVHSATALVADGAWPAARPQADAVVSATPGVVCGALAADCAPILFADAEAGSWRRPTRAGRAPWTGSPRPPSPGWSGLGARRERIVAVVGPCIGPASYEVGLEYVARFTEADPAYGRFFTAGGTPDKRQFDLPAFVLMRLKAAGVARCEWVGRDTCAEPDLFFSNRRAFKQGERD